MRRLSPWLIALLLASAIGLQAQGGRGFGGPPPDVTGKWTGIWNAYDPAQGATPPKEMCKTLDATITKEGEVWKAVFEGDCGRPYKYKISMKGRLVGGVVLFTGTVDLGAQDGGIYDWVGRATIGELIGFYTSAYATGFFNLKRAPQ